MEIDKTSAIKTIGDTEKSFSSVIQKVLEPDNIDLALDEAHKELIQKAINGDPIDPNVFDFLCGYKKLVKQQKRCWNIADKAKAFLENSAKPNNIKEDWLEFFFDKAKLVCSEEMQSIWAKLLAEEANEPGSISPSLLHSLSIMRYDQAEFFCNISRFAFREFKRDGVHLLLFVSTNREAYANSGIDPDKLKDLERIGLIQCNFDKEYIFERKKVFATGNKVLTIYGDSNNNRKIKAGNVKFTYDGKKLYSIIDQYYKNYRSDIFDFVVERLKNRNCTIVINDSEII